MHYYKGGNFLFDIFLIAITIKIIKNVYALLQLKLIIRSLFNNKIVNVLSNFRKLYIIEIYKQYFPQSLKDILKILNNII